MTRTPTALAILILLTVFAFGVICGFMLGALAMRPYACLDAQINSLQAEVGKAR